jgi:hypothetical protein
MGCHHYTAERFGRQFDLGQTRISIAFRGTDVSVVSKQFNGERIGEFHVLFVLVS